MGSSAQLYNLGWSDFDSSLKCAVKGLRSRGDLVDVTLSAGGKTFPAHKLVLSAASNLFLELLKVTPCQHPVILLAGIGSDELEQVLDFVYTGEVSVRPAELSALLQAAHVLNIHGLVQGSITAEKPEDQDAAEAAMAASSEAGEKVNAASLAAATKAGMLQTVTSGSGSARRKRKIRWKDGDCDAPHDKWGKYDSDDESSDVENTPNDTTTNTIATQTTATSPTTQSTVSQTIQDVLKTNVSSSNELVPKAPKSASSSVGSTSSSANGGKQEQCLPDVQTECASSPNIPLSDLPRSGLPIVDGSLVPPHHLEMTEDEENKDETLYSLLVKASQGGSNQPGVCPLCGTAVRQARNLRRHLFTSCKLRVPHLYHGEIRTTLTSEHRTLCVMGGEKQTEPDSALSQLAANATSGSLLNKSEKSKASVEYQQVDIKEECMDDSSSDAEEIVCRPYIMSPETVLSSPSSNCKD